MLRLGTASCTVEVIDGVTFFSSPFYPGEYPTTFVCSFGPLSEDVGTVTLSAVGFDLGEGDTVVIENPYTEPLVLSGSIAANTEYTIFSNYFVATFTSDSALTSTGFSLSFSQNTRNCDEDLIALLSSQSVRSLRSPVMKAANKYCEYRITADDPTKRVEIAITRFKVGTDAFLAINPDGDALYSNDVFKVQNPLTQTTFTSTGNVLRVLYCGASSAYGFDYYKVD
ncbi:deleted in malignant brain tumors 1 protein-like [Penaeus japonicus]|uniref:deleted in malignant brain tumors 1 protein-like n=1 Tax=Penaeus japonicus TaxID=27405 RepID=UPI001C71781B|nr:deleted in malignant brain tumors 1 protein-like [Penaeus japonicus]